MILAIITAILAYRRAKEHGRNAILWALAGAGVWIGAQLVVQFAVGLFYGFGIEFLGWSEEALGEGFFIGPVTVVSIGASILASWLLLRYLDRPIVDETETYSPPPPPPRFDGE